MKTPLSFTPIHALLEKREDVAWASYWEASGRVIPFYPAYIDALMRKIKASGAKRLFIIHSDRALFLAAFLAALHADIPVVFPPSDAPGLLKDILEPEDGLFTDQNALSPISPSFITMDDVTIDPQRPVKFQRFNPLKASITFYTSGSTGSPKAISKVLKQLEEEIIVLEEMWGIQDNRTTFLSTVPHHHMYGLLFSLLWPICAGYPIRSQTFAYWEDVLRECNQESYIVSSPSHLSRFPAFMESHERANIKAAFSSGAPLSFESSQEACSLLGICPIEVYGSTETGGIAYRQQREKDELWTKFKDVNLFLGEEENLCVKSPFLPHNGPYQTADRVTLQGEHHFHLLGRTDSIVKIEGKRVCLLEIEHHLRELEFIKEAAVLLLDTFNRDELGAVVVLSPKGKRALRALGKEKFVRNIRKSLSTHLEIITLPRKWRFVSELPLNQNGKRSHLLLKNGFVERS